MPVVGWVGSWQGFAPVGLLLPFFESESNRPSGCGCLSENAIAAMSPAALRSAANVPRRL